MCGIVGYVGSRDSVGLLLEGLRRLEYRGYDSAGIATAKPESGLQVAKAAGRIDDLTRELSEYPLHGKTGIGHTRWATHGPATEENAHPHFGGNGALTLAHNGVIENFAPLKDQLEVKRYKFRSATDTEVIAHLIADHLERELVSANRAAKADPRAPYIRAVSAALAQLRGTYGLVVLFRDRPDMLVAARLGSPLVIGISDDEHFVASDASALAGHTERIVYLADHQLAVVTADSLQVTHRDQGQIQHRITMLEVGKTEVDLGQYDHYMLKEIFEQPDAIGNAMRGRICEDDATAVFGGLNLSAQELRQVRRIVLTACGTSWHSALIGEYVLEEFARIPVEVEYASELRYRNPPVDDRTLLFAITQSGETADTLAALREMKRKGHPTLAICNVVGSTIAQEADGGVYLHAGPEIGVASTKAFTSQCVVLTMLALYLGRMRHLSFVDGLKYIDALRKLPEDVSTALETNDVVRDIAHKYAGMKNFLYLGRQYNFPTALEGALKLKEISYIHAEGYPAAEMKHGPIALVDEQTPSVFVVPQGYIYDKVMSNLEEIKARGGPIIAVVENGDKRVEQIADDVIRVPAVEPFLQPIVSVVPLQLLSYHMAVQLGCDVDKPRNLAKSVTVE